MRTLRSRRVSARRLRRAPGACVRSAHFFRYAIREPGLFGCRVVSSVDPCTCMLRGARATDCRASQDVVGAGRDRWCVRIVGFGADRAARAGPRTGNVRGACNAGGVPESVPDSGAGLDHLAGTEPLHAGGCNGAVRWRGGGRQPGGLDGLDCGSGYGTAAGAALPEHGSACPLALSGAGGRRRMGNGRVDAPAALDSGGLVGADRSRRKSAGCLARAGACGHRTAAG